MTIPEREPSTGTRGAASGPGSAEAQRSTPGFRLQSGKTHHIVLLMAASQHGCNWKMAVAESVSPLHTRRIRDEGILPINLCFRDRSYPGTSLAAWSVAPNSGGGARPGRRMPRAARGVWGLAAACTADAWARGFRSGTSNPKTPWTTGSEVVESRVGSDCAHLSAPAGGLSTLGFGGPGG